MNLEVKMIGLLELCVSGKDGKIAYHFSYKLGMFLYDVRKSFGFLTPWFFI